MDTKPKRNCALCDQPSSGRYHVDAYWTGSAFPTVEGCFPLCLKHMEALIPHIIEVLA